MAWIFDTALEGRAPYAGKVYFFRGTRYLRYDWTLDRLDQRPAPLSAWNLPSPFSSGVDAAVNGLGSYLGRAYFFRGGQYVRYDWASNTVGPPTSLAAWHLPAPFLDGVDAAINGYGAREGKTFFFRDKQYATYDWATDTTTAPRPLTDWNLVGMFANGIHAGVNGEGAYAGKAYLFRGAHYQRYDWATSRPDIPRSHLSRWNLGSGP
jgi:hypothetical protein